MADNEKQEPREKVGLTPDRLTIIGIGVSAGGVRTLQPFLEALDDHVGAALVVVVHLDPFKPSELAAIFAAHTAMPVTQVGAAVSLEPDHVYVIPPNRRLRISDGYLSAEQFDEPRGQRAPIDLFFRSMAEQHSDGFAVILSGAGSDGSIGIKAVKEAGGVIIVQDPNEAEYESMPRSAVATKMADFVLPIHEIASRLPELVRTKKLAEGGLRDVDEEYVIRILAHLNARTGHDFSRYKRSTVLRRIGRRIQVTGKEKLDQYYSYLRENADEVQALFGDLLISVTTFFRDKKCFDTLAEKVIPRLFEGKEALRGWVAGAATGEEAYTFAMLLLKEAGRHEFRPKIQVFGSDLDPSALALAREGFYPLSTEADVSEERLRR